MFFSPIGSTAQEVDPREKRQIDFAVGLYQRGDYSEAVEEFEVYLENPEWKSRREVALFFLGEAYRQLNETSQAESKYRQFLEGYSSSRYSLIATYRLAEIHIDNKQGEKAIALLGPLIEKELSADLEESVYYALGVAHSLAGESQSAIDWWGKGRKKFPEGRTDLQLSLGIGTESFRLGHWETAEKELSRWIGRTDASDSPTYSDALSKLAQAYENMEQLEEAKSTWLQLAEVTQNPGLLERALLSGAKNAFSLEQWAVLDEIAPRLAQSVRGPASRFQMNLLYGNRFYREKEWKKAAGYYSKALEGIETLPFEKPEERENLREETTIRYGWCLFAIEEWAELQSALQALADSGSKTPELLYLLGEAWKGKGDAVQAIRWFTSVPEGTDLSLVAKRTAADLAYSSEQWDAVANLYLDLSREADDPKERIFYRLRAADGARKLEKFDQAAELYSEVRIESTSETVQEKATYLKGWCLQRSGNLKSAISSLVAFSETYPHSDYLPESLFLLGQSYEKTGDDESTVQILEDLNKQFPESQWTAEGLLILAGVYSRGGDFEKVLESLVAFQERFPEKKMNSAYALWLAKSLTDRARHDEALVTLAGLEGKDLSQSEEEDRLFLLAQNLRKTKRYPESRDAYRRVLEEFSEGRHLPEIHLGLGIAAKQMDQSEEARTHSEKALNLLETKGVGDPAIEAQIYLLAGDLAFESDEYDAAYRFYAKPSILVRHPVFTPLAIMRSAECKERLGDTEKAESLRQELLRDYPESEAAKELAEVPDTVESPGAPK